MTAGRLILLSGTLILLVASLLFPPGAQAAGKTVYVGGTMSLTGPYAEDSAATLAGYEDYVKYVNETKRLAPWRSGSGANRSRFPRRCETRSRTWPSAVRCER